MDINTFAIQGLVESYNQVGILLKKKFGKPGYRQIERCNSILKDISDPEQLIRTIVEFTKAFCELLDGKMPEILADEPTEEGPQDYNLLNRTERRAKYLAESLELSGKRSLKSSEARLLLEQAEHRRMHPQMVHRALELIPMYLHAKISKTNSGIKRVIIKKDVVLSKASNFFNRENHNSTLSKNGIS